MHEKMKLTCIGCGKKVSEEDFSREKCPHCIAARKKKMRNAKYGFKGIRYDNQEDFLQAVEGFNSSLITLETMENLVDELMENIKMNLTLHIPNITNHDLREKLEDIFMYSLNVLIDLKME